ncbi:MAG: ferritin family protein [Candidatus Aminicenantales bacterium]
MKFGNLKDVMTFAIQREEEAARTYRKLRTIAKEEPARRLLADLEEEEKNHKKILQRLTRVRVEATASKTVKDLMISDYLVEEPLAPDMNFQDLLIFAAKKEKKAADLYLDLAKRSTIKDHRALFEFLAKQEKVHKLRLELEYEKHVLWED